jgi:hypothetical protein
MAEGFRILTSCRGILQLGKLSVTLLGAPATAVTVEGVEPSILVTTVHC